MIHAKQLKDVKIGNKLIHDGRKEGQGFVMYTVEGIDKEDQSVIIDGGLNYYPNSDEHYIVVD